MCGRYTLVTGLDELLGEFDLIDIDQMITHRYNVAPTQTAPVVRAAPESANGLISEMRWGLIPSWAKDLSIGNRMINARSETAAQKPSFRAAFKRRRCLVPASGFYEWKVGEGEATGRRPPKQPYYIHRKDERLAAFAGLWESWTDPTGEEIESFTILTTEPNSLMAPLHDRMPVILNRNQYALWLDPNLETSNQLAPLLKPCDPKGWEAHPVARRVNSPRFDDPACIVRFDPGPDNLFT